MSIQPSNRAAATRNAAAKGNLFGMLRSCVLEHFAYRRHFDFRLEYVGVLESSAVPKSCSEVSGIKRLGSEVADLELARGDLEGRRETAIHEFHLLPLERGKPVIGSQ